MPFQVANGKVAWDASALRRPLPASQLGAGQSLAPLATWSRRVRASSLQGLVRRVFPGVWLPRVAHSYPRKSPCQAGRHSGLVGLVPAAGLMCVSPSVYLEDLIKAGFLQEIDALIFCVVSREAEFYFLSNI